VKTFAARVAQRKQHRQPRGVLDQAAAAQLGAAELLLDAPEGVLGLGPYAGLGLLELRGDELRLDERVEPQSAACLTASSMSASASSGGNV
jgi:hypothetical protein